LGTRNNKNRELNAIFDVGDKIIHFAGVGSGLNFTNMATNNKKISVPSSYVKFGMERYNLYSQIFFNKRIIDSNVNDVTVEKFKKFMNY